MGLYTRKDSRFWWMHLEGLGKKLNTRIPVGEGSTRKEQRRKAQQVYNKAMGDVATGRFKLPSKRAPRTFREQAEWFYTNVASHHKGGRRAKSIIGNLTAYFADTALDAVDVERLEEWKTARAKVVQKQTVNRELDVLKPLMRSAVPKYLERSPADDVHRFPTRRFVPVTILSESAEAALLAVVSDVERAFILLGLDALLRLGDVRTFREEFNHGTHLEIPDPKTGVPYRVPASTRLQKAIGALTPKGGFYFWKVRWKGEKRGQYRAWSEAEAFKAFADLCMRADVLRGRDAGGITYHSLRHTGASRASRVVKPTAVMKLGGWSSLRQLARYDHPDESDLLRAVEAIGELRSGYSPDPTKEKPPISERFRSH